MGVANQRVECTLACTSPHSVQLWTCNGGPRQQWIMDNQTQEIKLKSDEKCLNIANQSTDNGANICIYTCHPDSQPQNQQVSVKNLLLCIQLSWTPPFKVLHARSFNIAICSS